MFLKGKTALITGSTSGIGLGYAKALAAEGANVMINGFGDATEIEKERAGLAALSGGKALYSDADMTKPQAIAAMVKTCADQLGGPDIVINNAGIQFVSPVDQFPDDFKPARQKETSIEIIPLWSTWITFAAVISLLMVEWFVRKMVNLA